MITKKTVLVLGAGASMPFGFPSGQGLVDKISHTIVKWFDYRESKNIRGIGNKEKFGYFIKKLQKADPPSIDIFLEAHPDLQPVGKAAIAMALLPLEHTGNLKEKFGRRRVMKKSSRKEEREKAEILSDIFSADNWYQYLFYSKLWDSFETFDKNELSVITFNYDRSFEQSMFTSLTAMAPENTHKEKIIEKVKAIKIIHPHGKLGPLEWEPHGHQEEIPYDSDLDELLIGRASRNIKIISDATAREDFREAHEELESSKRIYFLGFGFDETNVRRLLPEHIRGKLSLRGTSYGLSPHQITKMDKLGIKMMDGSYVNNHFPPKKVFEYLYNDPNAILD